MQESLESALKRLTPRAKTIIQNAASAAERYGHSYIGREHILIALANCEGGVAHLLLTQAGISEGMIADECGYIAVPEGLLQQQNEIEEYLRLRKKYRALHHEIEPGHGWFEFVNIIGELQKLQESQGWTPVQLAKELDISVSTLNRVKKTHRATNRFFRGFVRLSARFQPSLIARLQPSPENPLS